jgi:hypothetical protein
MNRRLWGVVAAAGVACGLLTGPAIAQDQLRESVSSQLSRLSIQVPNLASLSDTQIAQLELILNTSESEHSKALAVNALLAVKPPCEGNAQLRAQVARQLQDHRITVPNFDTISGTELVMVAAVLNTTESEGAKRGQIERIFASDSPLVAGDQLRADAEQCVRMVNAEVDLGPLTAEQLVQIELVAGGTESESDKRAMIEQIANQ